MEQRNIEDNNIEMNNINSMVEKLKNIVNLKHPNLLDYISVWYNEKKNRIIIITELLQGGNLQEYRKYQKKLKVKLVKKWIKQILTGLDYLHNNNYIHHDIKSQNILIDRISGNLKLGDLLCAEKLGDKNYFNKYIGTEEFMAPEVKEGKYNFKADIYSLGLTILQFITMEKPYKEYSRKKGLYEAKKQGKYPLSLKYIKNEEIKNFISLCLKEEKDRPTCKELLQNKWLNDKDTKDNNKFIELENNSNSDYINIDKSRSCAIFNEGNINKNILNESENSLLNISGINLNRMSRKDSSYIRPLYSLEISKLNSSELKGTRKNSENQVKFGSFKSNKPLKLPCKIKSLFCFNRMNEEKNKEIKATLAERKSSKSIGEMISQNNIIYFNDEISDYNIIYLYIIENNDKLFCIFNEKEEKKEKKLLKVKIEVPYDKRKKQILIKIKFKLQIRQDQENFDIIIKELKNLIKLNEKDVILIRNKLEEKICKIIKEKKLKNLKNKIDKIISNFEFLIHNKELDSFEYFINNDSFDIRKLPNEIDDKIKLYKEKKFIVEKLLKLKNININYELNNQNGNICKEYIIINLSENENN